MTLEELLKAGVTVIATEPATMVPPRYRGLPKEEQIESPVHGVEKLLLSTDVVMYKCLGTETTPCGELYDSVYSTVTHRVAHSETIAQRRASNRASKAAETKRLQRGYGALEKALANATQRYEELRKAYEKLVAEHEKCGDAELRTKYQNLQQAFDALATEHKKCWTGESSGTLEQKINAVTRLLREIVDEAAQLSVKAAKWDNIFKQVNAG